MVNNKININNPRILKKIWEDRLLLKVETCHKRNLLKVVGRILKKISSAKGSLVSRSKKYGVECNVTTEELRQLVYENYGEPCKYCGKILTVDTLVFDHIIPISKKGSSNIENLQIICKSSNGVKGSLTEDNFNILLDWLQTIPEELKKDVTTRLARGVV